MRVALAPGSRSVALVYERKNERLPYDDDTCCIDGLRYIPCRAGAGRLLKKR